MRPAQAERVLDESPLAQRGVERGDPRIELRSRTGRAQRLLTEAPRPAGLARPCVGHRPVPDRRRCGTRTLGAWDRRVRLGRRRAHLRLGDPRVGIFARRGAGAAPRLPHRQLRRYGLGRARVGRRQPVAELRRLSGRRAPVVQRHALVARQPQPGERGVAGEIGAELRLGEGGDEDRRGRPALRLAVRLAVGLAHLGQARQPGQPIGWRKRTREAERRGGERTARASFAQGVIELGAGRRRIPRSKELGQIDTQAGPRSRVGGRRDGVPQRFLARPHGTSVSRRCRPPPSVRVRRS